MKKSKSAKKSPIGLFGINSKIIQKNKQNVLKFYGEYVKLKQSKETDCEQAKGIG